MNNALMFSSKTDLWETPKDLFDKLNREFCFTVDVCALPENAKCKRYFTPDVDGLKQEWTGICWCNPPYGRQLAKWIKKAAESSGTVVMLLPARTDTKWFHDFVLPYGEIRWIRGRLKFGGGKKQRTVPEHDCYFQEFLIMAKEAKKKEKQVPKDCICGKPAVIAKSREGKMVTCPDPLNCKTNLRTRWSGHETVAISEWNNLVAEYVHRLR